MSEAHSGGNRQQRYDVIQFTDGRHEVVLAGEGGLVVEAHRDEDQRRQVIATLTVAIVGGVLGVAGAGWLLNELLIAIGVGLVMGVGGGVVRYRMWGSTPLPKVAATDVPESIVRDYVDEFEPSTVESIVTS